jgi:3-deoxy-D-manno-octulosonic-acid transferase
MNALDLLYCVGAAALAPVWARKSRGGWNERFGKIEPLPTKKRSRVLVHGVSVGEINALRQLIPMIAQHCEVVVTASTDTGLARAKELYGNTAVGDHAVFVRRYPLDFSKSVRRFLDVIEPDAVALCELEIWPNFVSMCAARNVPVAIVNGRLSARSFRGYRKARVMLHKSFERLKVAAVQDEQYASRFRFMGVPDDRLMVTGSMKWDTAVITDHVSGALELASDMGIDLSKPLVVAGSTAEGEEALLHEATPPGVQLLCAPRNVERFDDAAKAMPGCIRRSTVVASGKPARQTVGSLQSQRPRFLLDTLGELRKAYALATIAVIGRSFGRLYGSDPIEPIGLGKPTIIGPAFGNFSTIVDTLVAAGGLQVVQAGELRVHISELLARPAIGKLMAERGRAAIRAHQGATERHAKLIIAMVGSADKPTNDKQRGL